MKTHDTDLVSLGAGLLFLAIAGLWLVTRFADVDGAVWAALVPITLLVVGGLGIAQAIRAARRRD